MPKNMAEIRVNYEGEIAMQRMMLLSKIHRAYVTQRDKDYIGSITIDKNLLDATGMRSNERVEVYDIDNGNRFSTYIFEGEAGSGVIGVNGAAARLVSIGDRVIIVNYGILDESELENFEPKVVVVDSPDNRSYFEID